MLSISITYWCHKAALQLRICQLLFNLLLVVFHDKNTGGLRDYNLLERLGEGSKPTAIIGDVADDLNLDLVVISMEAIHTKHIDANLLAEFIPCPVMLLPL